MSAALPNPERLAYIRSRIDDMTAPGAGGGIGAAWCADLLAALDAVTERAERAEAGWAKSESDGNNASQEWSDRFDAERARADAAESALVEMQRVGRGWGTGGTTTVGEWIRALDSAPADLAERHDARVTVLLLTEAADQLDAWFSKHRPSDEDRLSHWFADRLRALAKNAAGALTDEKERKA